MPDRSPSAETVKRISQTLADLLRQSRRLARFYLDASRMARNPAFADLLEDYSASERVASLEFEELILRAGAEVPLARRAPTSILLALSIRFRPRSGDHILSSRLLQEESTRTAVLVAVQEDMQRAGADPEALQRLSEIRITIRQRIELFQERLAAGG